MVCYCLKEGYFLIFPPEKPDTAYRRRNSNWVYTREYHIYDSDNTRAHARECELVNQRGDGSSARMTQKREMENDIHSHTIQEVFGIQIEVNDTMDVSTEISNIIRRTNPEGYRPDTVKKKLNKICAQRMTLELLHSRDPQDEVPGWLREISQIIAE